MKTRSSVNNTKSAVVFLKGKKTTLRPVSEKDIPLFLRWFNDPEIRPFITAMFPMTEGGEREWVEGLAKKSDKDIVLVIEVKGSTIGIHRINWQSRVGTTGAVIGEKEYWNNGYGTDAKMAVLDYAFNTLNLRKISSSVKAFNKRSLAYSLHCGYKVEGRLRRQHFALGKYWDEVVLGVFRDEWLPHWERYRKNGK